MSDCGCNKRKARLNAAVPGLGDHVELFLSPVQPIVNSNVLRSTLMNMDLLKPDMKSLVWLAIGAFVVPYVLKLVK
jgi:hypothetical protein